MPAPLSLTLADLPERSEPLEGLSAIVWADDSSGLSEAQRRSIERWVANGGQLVIVGGADWQARTAGFAEILPVDGLTAVDDVEQAALASWAGAEAHGRRVGHRFDRNTARRRAWPDPGRRWDAPGVDADGRCGPGHPRRYRSRDRCLPGLGRISAALGAAAADQCGAGAVLRRLPARGDPERDGHGAEQPAVARGPTGRAAARRHRGVHPPHRTRSATSSCGGWIDGSWRG